MCPFRSLNQLLLVLLTWSACPVSVVSSRIGEKWDDCVLYEMSHWCWPFLGRTTTAAIEQAKTKRHWLISLLVARSLDWLIDWLVDLSLSVYQSVRSSAYPSVCFRNYRKLSSFSFPPVWIIWTFALFRTHVHRIPIQNICWTTAGNAFDYICLCPERQPRETICACNRQSDPPPGTTLDIIGLRSTSLLLAFIPLLRSDWCAVSMRTKSIDQRFSHVRKKSHITL